MKFKQVKVDAITFKLSDHNPVIHGNVLFWNVMMQGKQCIRSGKISFNNGFSLVEDNKQYNKRLIKIAKMIAYIINFNHTIEIIGLCEGPIQPKNVKVFLETLYQYERMLRFNLIANKAMTLDSKEIPNWGLISLVDKNTQKIDDKVADMRVPPTLANRFQFWKGIKGNKKVYYALAHFPLDGNEEMNDKANFKNSGKVYVNFIKQVLNKYADNFLVFCADFNFNPYLISDYHDRACDAIPYHNSIFLKPDGVHFSVKYITVDGILLSKQSKQRFYSLLREDGLFKRVVAERKLVISQMIQYLEDNRHENKRIQQIQ